LLAQPGDWFTLQLVSVSSAERALAYINRQSAPEQFASYELERDGRRLYVVVYGLFETRSEADAASRALPAGVGEVKPWIRTLEQVHGAIYTVR
jgi:DamX protein